MGRDRNTDGAVGSYGFGYPFLLESKFSSETPGKHVLINRGISGNRTVDLYARIKSDCWNLKPDLISVLIGVNDVWHEVAFKNGVDIERFERVYRMFIDDTEKVLADVKLMLLEPFVLKGTATEEKYGEFSAVREYARAVRKIAEEKNIPFVPLQARFDELSEKYGAEQWLYDGVHPSVAGAKVIADAWLEVFKANFE